jgi:hypothetical protein
MSDGENDERFRERLLDATAWDETAVQLLNAAELLEPKVREFWAHPDPCSWSNSWRGWADEFVAIYFMLVAYAIENLLKGRIIRANSKALRSEVEVHLRMPDTLKTHDLCALAKQAGKAGLASGYADILKRLSRSATWYGRYPVPIRPQGLEPFTQTSEGEHISLTHYSSSDLHEIRRVVTELKPPTSS